MSRIYLQILQHLFCFKYLSRVVKRVLEVKLQLKNGTMFSQYLHFV